MWHCAEPCGRVSQFLAALLLLAGVPHDYAPWTSFFSPVVAAAAQNSAASENSQQTPSPGFVLRTERNLVLVRVVVWDSKGNPVDGLSKDSFRLFDNGKPQVISHFAVEKAAGAAEAAAAPAAKPALAQTPEEPPAVRAPERYVILYFDDIHSSFEDIVHAREAAEQFLASAVAPSDRLAISTTSGDIAQEFTSDLGSIRRALARLRSRFRGGDPKQDCPSLSDYVADRIVNFNDGDALSFALAQAAGQGCPPPDPHFLRMMAHNAEEQYRAQAQSSLTVLEHLVRSLSMKPGERNLILVSPGFLTLLPSDKVEGVIDRALRDGVVISTLDPEGLTNSFPWANASQEVPGQPSSRVRQEGIAGVPNLATLVLRFTTDIQAADWDILAELAEGTGGRFFHNNNDLAAGLRLLAAAPEVSYLLAYSPEKLQFDGKFHRLKVELVNGHGLTVMARRGYFAPAQASGAEAQADKEIADAAFSRYEVNELPVRLSTKFYRLDEHSVQLAIQIHLDSKALPFRKEGGRNIDDLRFVTVLFDRDGNYVDGHEKKLSLRLKDSNLAQVFQTGIDVQDKFRVAPGTYWVREVVRDSEGGELTALNQSVEIAF
jgi:VWFA-related protein